MRRTVLRRLGYTPINPDTSPMLQYSNYHWHYNFLQGMEFPRATNRSMDVPFSSPRKNVNLYRHGVWIELDMPAAYRIALEPQLSKLAIGRTIPRTEASEAAADFKKLSPLIAETHVQEAWLAKVVQLTAFQQKADIAKELWASSGCEDRYTVLKEAAPSSGSSTVAPTEALVFAMLFSLARSMSPEWKLFFTRCLKNGWNMTPRFPTALWSELLRVAGALDDQAGVMVLLEEMLDVHGDLEHLSNESVVYALNSVTGASEYNYVKKYLFHFSERKTERLSKHYGRLRTLSAEEGDSAPKPPLKDNDNMFYHVTWHVSIRQPRKFSPRQLFFDYQPAAMARTGHNPNAKIDAVVKDKVAQWKQQGLLPEDYEFTDQVYDKSAAFKNVMRQEKWKKWPKMLKDKRFGYFGDL